MNHPYLPLYTGDWKKDPRLSLCSVATRGVWIDLLCSLHDGRIGQVTGTPEQIARLCRCNAAECHAALLELQTSGAANVSERDGVFTVVCRRMKKAIIISQLRAECASKRPSKPLAKPKQPPDIESEIEIGFKTRLGKLFNRRVTTPWSEKELKAFAALSDLQEADIELIEVYYQAKIEQKNDFRRRDLLTLLNNWNGEVDRAKARPQYKRKTIANGTNPDAPPLPDPVDEMAKRADFRRRIAQWKENGRPLGEFPM